jgi:uncharacterized LabA/DUF88 family protein
MSRTKRARVAVYIDGFNLYHALVDLQQPHLKWLNLKNLSEYLIKPRSQRLVSVKYFSAFANHFSNTEQVGSLVRHRLYVAALEAKGVECLMGNFAKRDRYFRGRGYRARWRRYEEKQTDVGIGVHLINDAHNDRFDRALVIGVDTDLLPVFELMRTEFPEKPVVCVAPPHRQHHRDLQRVAAECEVIKVSQIERSLFGATVTCGGSVVARRPRPYRPP